MKAMPTIPVYASSRITHLGKPLDLVFVELTDEVGAVWLVDVVYA
jgi:hypothetical protein